MERITLGDHKIYEYDNSSSRIEYTSKDNKNSLVISFSRVDIDDPHSWSECLEVSVTKKEKPRIKLLPTKESEVFSQMVHLDKRCNNNLTEVMKKPINLGDGVDKDIAKLINTARETIVKDAFPLQEQREAEKIAARNREKEQEQKANKMLQSKLAKEMKEFMK